MLDTEFAKYLSTLGIGGILAVIFYYQARKDSQNFVDMIKSLYEVEKGRTEMLLSVVKDNTVATTKNNTVLDALHRRLDREEYEKRNGIK